MVLTPAGTPHANYRLSATDILGTAGDIVSITPGYDVLWVAGIACGAFNFASTVTTDGGSQGIVIHTDTADANLQFSPGDLVQELDNTVVGTIALIGSPGESDVDVDITFVQGSNVDDIADGVKLYHRQPITLELSFEK